MKTINLLPRWYSQQRRRHRNLKIHVAVMLLLGGLMFGARVVGQRRLEGLTRHRDELKTTLAQTPDPDAELLRRQNELRRLEDLRQARRELGSTVPMSAVIQQLQNDMSPGMALSNVVIDVRSEPVKGSGFVGDTHNPPRYRDVAHIDVTGIAPPNKNNILVDQFIDRISRNVLFSDVTLTYTRAGILESYQVCKFEIQLSMDLERLTTVVPDAVGATVDAGTAHPAGRTDGR